MKLVYTIFVVDDEESIREGISLSLGSSYRVKTYVTAEEAISGTEWEPPDLVLLDIGLPGMNGVEALSEFKQRDPDLPVVMITAFEDFKTVISAMKAGAYDYVVKPLHMGGLRVTIENALETVRLRKEVRVLQERYLRENLPFFIGESDAMQDVMELIGLVAKSPDTPILVIGETGTGKELIASAIHYRSPNFKGPLVTVNCGAIPKNLIESELFGYEKGAFSGASPSGKKGLVEGSAGGTLFLDEVGDLSQEAQAKLLRFLEEGEFYRVGGTSTIRVQTRVVSATNRDIAHMIKEGSFRTDLYFRLGVVKIEVPSLQERRDDILPLAKHFLLEFNRKFGRDIIGFSPETEEALLNHTWVGNVRELKNCVERGVLTCRGRELSRGDLGLAESASSPMQTGAGAPVGFPPIPPNGIDFPAIEKRFERYYIEEALKRAGGNESQAARFLNVNHHTFRYRRRKLQEADEG
jgi:DNA-binding NtrC family response regulator